MPLEINTIDYNSEKVAVEEICREHFGFILYKSISGTDFFIAVVRNQSFAYWNEVCKIDECDAMKIIKNPTYTQALQILEKVRNQK